MAGRENLERAQAASDEAALRTLAERASFQAFINGYLREIDAGSRWNIRQWQQRYPDKPLPLVGPSLIELRLPAQDYVLLLDVTYFSLVGCHTIQAVYCRRGAHWSQEGFWSALLTLVKEIYQGRRVWVEGPVKTRQLELTYRLTDSLQNMIMYLRKNPKMDVQDFIEAEQGLVFGHWLHPTPKSRQGILEWQHPLFAPECHGEFLLHYFAVDRPLIITGAAEQSLDPETLALEAADWPLDILQENEVLIPCHPLQAQWLLARQELQSYFRDGRIRSLGAMGRCFTATSSVRTVYRADFPWMFKFSIPVKITNSLRQNKKHELAAGLMMTRLCASLDFFKRFPQFHLVADPGYMAVEIPGLKESGFEWIIRHNPFMREKARQKLTLAALLQDSQGADFHQSPLQQMLEQQALTEGRSAQAVALDWFDAYWKCAVEPLLYLLDEWGIALEAHQQNSVLDVKGCYPQAYFYRDNQGFYLALCQQKKILTRLPSLSGCPELFYETQMLFDRFGYYLLFNQLFAVVARLGKDGYADEHFWLQYSREKFESLQLQLTGLGRDFIQRCLHNSTLPSKANLLTRVQDIDELEADQELAVYVEIANPLQSSRKLQTTTAVVEYA